MFMEVKHGPHYKLYEMNYTFASRLNLHIWLEVIHYNFKMVGDHISC